MSFIHPFPLAVGGLVALVVLGLGRLADPMHAERLVSWDRAPEIATCPDVSPERVEIVRAFVAEQGARGKFMKFSTRACDELCEYRVEGNLVSVPCEAGVILVTNRMIEGHESHPGETVRLLVGDTVERATILLPKTFVKPTIVGEEGAVTVATLRDDIEELEVRHELGHALGFGHALTRTAWFPAFLWGKHVMAADILNVGPETTGM